MAARTPTVLDPAAVRVGRFAAPCGIAEIAATAMWAPDVLTSHLRNWSELMAPSTADEVRNPRNARGG